MIVLASPAVSHPPMTLAVAPTATSPDRPVATSIRLLHQIYTHRVHQGRRKGSGGRMLGRRFLRRGTSMHTSIGGMPASKRGSTHTHIAEITPNRRELLIEKVCVFLSPVIAVSFLVRRDHRLPRALPRSVCCVPRIHQDLGSDLSRGSRSPVRFLAPLWVSSCVEAQHSRFTPILGALLAI